MNAVADSSSLAALLTARAEPDALSRAELRRQTWLAMLPLAVVVALVVLWAASAPLAGAVIAPAQVKVELNRKTVQHQEGGIVREILVRDGQPVRAGDALLVVGDVRRDADLSLLRDQWIAQRLREARAQAEALSAARFDAPADIAADAATPSHLARERALFAARKRALDDQIASLQEQIRQAHAQAAALQTQIAASDASAGLADEEVRINETLVSEGFVNRTRMLGLQRAAADYRSRGGEHRADLAAARQRAGELQSRLAQVRHTYQTQAAAELKESNEQLREIEERLRPSQDQVERQLVRSPVDGVVMALRVAAAGTAIGPREPILDIVPARERLVVEARIRPEDIDHVRSGATADVRIGAFDANRTPPLPGSVTFVSPDRVSASDGSASWFVATIEVDAAALSAQRPRLQLQAGMPAEVFVTTPARTVIEYLARPLTLFNERVMREP